MEQSITKLVTGEHLEGICERDTHAPEREKKPSDIPTKTMTISWTVMMVVGQRCSPRKSITFKPV